MTRVRLLQAAGGPWTASTSAFHFPDASNTGATLGSLIAVPGTATSGTGWTWSSGQSAVQITGANAVFDGYDVSGGIQVKASNVTVRNSRIAGTVSVSNNAAHTTVNNNVISSAAGGSTILVQLAAGVTYSTVTNNTIRGGDATTGRALYGVDLTGTTSAPGVDPGLVVTGNDISFFKVGVSLLNTDATTNYLVQGNYMHDIGFITGDHSECVYASGAGTGSITGNTLLNSLNQTAAVFIQNKDAVTGNITVQGNLLAGGQYCVYGGGDPSSTFGLGTNISITGNYVSTQYFPLGGNTNYGTDWNTDPSNTWSGNLWYDGPNAGQVIAHP